MMSNPNPIVWLISRRRTQTTARRSLINLMLRDVDDFIFRIERCERNRRRYGEDKQWHLRKFTQDKHKTYAKHSFGREVRPCVEWYTEDGVYIVHAYELEKTAVCKPPPWEGTPTELQFAQVFSAVTEHLDSIYGPMNRNLYVYYHTKPVPASLLKSDRGLRDRHLKYRDPTQQDLHDFYYSCLETVVGNCYLGILLACHFARPEDRNTAEDALDEFGLTCVEEGKRLSSISIA